MEELKHLGILFRLRSDGRFEQEMVFTDQDLVISNEGVALVRHGEKSV